MGSSTSDLLSIKEVARLAGVTPRAVRHYHSIGVLPEPQRDSSGYRRYGGADVVALVRVTRLRALGMPLAKIAGRLSDTAQGEASPAEALRALADEIDSEIAQLVSTRDQLRELARSQTFDQPVETLTRALRDRGVLGPADQLRAGEGWAAAVLDAVHPEGMPGVLAQVTQLLTDPSTAAELRPLRRRMGRLTARTSDEEIATLAADVAAVLPPGVVEQPLVDLGLIEVLLTDRLNPAQRRFLDELRSRVQAGR